MAEKYFIYVKESTPLIILWPAKNHASCEICSHLFQKKKSSELTLMNHILLYGTTFMSLYPCEFMSADLVTILG